MNHHFAQFESLVLQKNVKSATCVAYKKDLAQFIHFMGSQQYVRIQDITAPRLRIYVTWLQQQHIARSSFARKISALKLFINFCIEQQSLQPIDLSCLELNSELPYLAPHHDLLNLIENCAEYIDTVPLKLILQLLYHSGLTVPEIIRLEGQHIQSGKGTLLLASKKKKLSLPKSVRESLKKYCATRQPQEKLFTITAKALTSIIKKLIKSPNQVPDFLQQVTRDVVEVIDLAPHYKAKHPRA